MASAAAEVCGRVLAGLDEELVEYIGGMIDAYEDEDGGAGLREQVKLGDDPVECGISR